MIDKEQEEYNKHWYEEDDLKAARGMFGLPLMVGLVIVGLLVWRSLF